MNDKATAEVTRLRPDSEATQPIQITVRRILDKDCDITATTAYFPKEGERPDHLLDGMMEAVKRQKAMYDITVAEQEIENATLEMEINVEDQKRRDKDLETEIADLGKSLVTARELYTRTFTSLKSSFEEKGKDFDATKPGNKNQLDPLAAEVNRIEESIKTKTAERLNDEKQTKRGIEVTNFRIAKAKARIEKLKKLI